MAAPTVVRTSSNANFDGTSSLGASLTGVAAGNSLVFVVLGTADGATIVPNSVSAPGGSAWSAPSVGQAAAWGGSVAVGGAVYVAHNVNAGSHTITASGFPGGALYGSVVLIEVAGLGDIVAFGTAGADDYDNYPLVLDVATAGAPPAGDGLVLALASTTYADYAPPAAIPVGAGYTNLYHSGVQTYDQARLVYRAATFDGASPVAWQSTATGTGDGAQGWASLIVAFTAAGGDPPGDPISGQTSITFTATGALRGTVSLSGNTGITFTATGALERPANALSGSTSLSLVASGALRGRASLAGSARLGFAAAAALRGRASVAGSTGLAFGSSAHLVGKVPLAGATGIAFAASGALRSSGAVSGRTGLTLAAAARLRARASLAGAASLTFRAAIHNRQPEANALIALRPHDPLGSAERAHPPLGEAPRPARELLVAHRQST